MADIELSAQVEGIRQMAKALDAHLPAVISSAKAVVRKELEAIFEKSQKQVPIDTGALKDSGYIEEPKWDPKGDRIVGTIGYGGKKMQVNPKTYRLTEEYALAVHENLTARYRRRRKAKFLEDPLNEALPGLRLRMAIHLARTFKK